MISYAIDLALGAWGEQIEDEWAYVAAGLCGESGELMDLWKKEKFRNLQGAGIKMIDEVGDISFYFRIALALTGANAKGSLEGATEDFIDKSAMPVFFDILVEVCGYSVDFARSSKDIGRARLIEAVKGLAYNLHCVVLQLDWTFGEVFLLNWMKLYDGHHGWENQAKPIKMSKVVDGLGLDHVQMIKVVRAHTSLGRELDRFMSEA